MPNVSLSTDIFAAGILANLMGDANAIGYLSADTTAGSYTSPVFTGFGSTQQVTIAGAALTSNSAAISLSGAAPHVTVLSSGQVSNTNSSWTPAIYMGNSGSLLTNFGTISGATGVAIYHSFTASGSPSQVVNHGTINGSGFGYLGDGFSTDRQGAGVYIDAGYYLSGETRDPVSIVNTGTISGAYQVDGTAPGYSILLSARISLPGDQVALSENSAVAVQVINSGTLMGTVFLLSQDDVVENSGLIHGNVIMGIGNDLVDSRQGQVQGTVFGDDGNDTIFGGDHGDAISGGGDNDSILGFDGADEIYGASGDDLIRGGAGADTLNGDSNNDEIHGGSGGDNIDGGSGADDIRGDSGDDTIFGGTGEDTIDGGSGEENIDGGANADVIFGRSGDDFIRGDTGSDQISGGAGDDTIAGNSGNDDIDGGSGGDAIYAGSNNDTVSGALGDDYIDGGTGDDLLRGGSDNDTLVGGEGQDTLSGGNGADVFVFVSVADSPHGVTRDTITDFEAGLDKIDLSGFGGLTFVASYTGTAGEVRYNDAVARLYIDTDGDMASDFSVDLTAGTGLTEGDLIL